MTEYEIPTLERTITGEGSMRSIADALEALRGDGRLEDCSFLEIRTGPLPSQAAQAPSLVVVVCHLSLPERPWGVALPSSWEFRGRPLGKGGSETFEISRLDRARVDEDGTVTLLDGTRLEAVEVIPAALPWELTELQKRIVYLTLKYIGAEATQYPSGRPVAEDLEFLDYSTLYGWDIPPLEEIADYLAKEDWALRNLSRQTIANALGACGMRRPRSRG